MCVHEHAPRQENIKFKWNNEYVGQTLPISMILSIVGLRPPVDVLLAVLSRRHISNGIMLTTDSHNSNIYRVSHVFKK